MHHKKTKRKPKSQYRYTVIAFLGLRVGTVPFGATAEAYAETADCSEKRVTVALYTTCADQSQSGAVCGPARHVNGRSKNRMRLSEAARQPARQ